MVMTGGIAGVQVPGQETRRDNAVSRRWVTPQFFTTMGIPILAGRDFEDGDTADRTWVAVVSESFVKRHWPDQNPIGKTFFYLNRPRTVVGVVGDVKVRGLERTSEPQMYLASPQVIEPTSPFYDPKELVVKHSGQGTSLVAVIRDIVRSVDPEQPISDIRPLDDILAGETATRRAQLQILGTVAVIALLLAAVGIHGLLAYTVLQRRQEIGVRLALGAEPSGVARMVVSDGMRLALIGIALGVPIAYAAARSMTTLLFGVHPADPATFATAAGVAFVMTLAGSLFPSLKALRVNPMSAMRGE